MLQADPAAAGRIAALTIERIVHSDRYAALAFLPLKVQQKPEVIEPVDRPVGLFCVQEKSGRARHYRNQALPLRFQLPC